MATKLGDLWKKGTSAPLGDDLVEGGLAVDVAGKKVYSKANDGGIFEVGGGGFAGEHNDLAGRSEVDTHPTSAITGLDSALSGKEPYLGKPSLGEVGYVLTSTDTGGRGWVPQSEGVTDHTLLDNIGTNTHDAIDGHIGDVTSNPHEVTASQVGAAPSNHNHDDLYFKEDEFIDESIDPSTSGSKPVLTTVDGKISMSFMQWEGLTYITTFTPVAGDLSTEYPDTAGMAFGSAWAVDIPADTTFEWTVGDLFDKGKIAEAGDFMVYGAGSDGLGAWGLISSKIDPDLYYKLDGSVSITDAFAGGGQQIKSIGDATDAQDAVALGQVQPLLDNYVEIVGDTMTGNLVFNHQSGIEMTTSLDAKKLVMNIDSSDKLIINSANLPVFTKGSWTFNSVPNCSMPASAAEDLTRKDYVDGKFVIGAY